MTISRVKSPHFSLGEKLTSAQASAIDQNIENALDKRSGQTDTLASVVTCSGAGRIIGTYAAGANANTTYLVSGANGLIDIATLTADRTYTFSNTNASAGDRIFILNRSSYYVTIKNAAASTLIVLGSEIQDNGESGWCEVMYTGSAWVLARSALRPALNAEVFTSSGTYTVPRGVNYVLVDMWGGGGQGGAGAAGYVGTAYAALGGGGGGAALRVLGIVAVTPGDAISVTVGAGGSGSPPLESGNHGGTSSFGTLLYAKGGSGGGTCTSAAYSSATGGSIIAGGSPVQPRANYYQTQTPGSLAEVLRRMSGGEPGYGGHGGNNTSSISGYGAPSLQGYSGGAAGAYGTADGSHSGGGGGGGGAGGPGGDGGAGGAGGNGDASVYLVGISGSAGTAAAANSGAGGGGGGGGGAHYLASSAGGAGGAGGSGKVIVIPMR